MKKLIVAAVALFSVSAFAQTANVDLLKGFLSPANKAKAEQGKILDVIVNTKLAPKAKKPAKSSTRTKAQALVKESSCYAGLYVETGIYTYGVEVADGCKTKTEYHDAANVAVDIDFETLSYDPTDIEVILYARNVYTNEVFEIDSTYYTHESDIWGDGANTVVFVVDADWSVDYDISADVYIDDELGQACLIETNSDVIY